MVQRRDLLIRKAVKCTATVTVFNTERRRTNNLPRLSAKSLGIHAGDE
jgi:hypothetical protein